MAMALTSRSGSPALSASKRPRVWKSAHSNRLDHGESRHGRPADVDPGQIEAADLALVSTPEAQAAESSKARCQSSEIWAWRAVSGMLRPSGPSRVRSSVNPSAK